MTELTLKLTAIAHGGSAIGRDENGRLYFVPYAIPGESCRVQVENSKNKYAHARLLQIIKPSSDRREAACPHFGTCGGCHLQHIRYERQLQLKEAVVRDQLQRLGGFRNINVRPIIPHPQQWQYRDDVEFSPAGNGRLGYWSPSQQKVIAIQRCPIIHPHLEDLLHDIDLDLPGLRKITLRRGSDGALLAALEVDDVEPPEIETDFPMSVAIVLPDKTAASLVGDIYMLKTVRGREFRISPGCFFQPSQADVLVDIVIDYAQLSGQETVIDAYSGVGMLTAFLAEEAAAVIGIEANQDAVADTAVNLYHTENVTLYQGWIEEVLPPLNVNPQLIVLNPPAQGLSRVACQAILAKTPRRIIYVSSDIATLARDGQQLAKAGYKLVTIQPIDLYPQAFHIDTISLWQY